jgi:hypothetical protein
MPDKDLGTSLNQKSPKEFVDTNHIHGLCSSATAPTKAANSAAHVGAYIT